ncbi:Crp/Fnr family transcriptional regulator [Halioxenophilus sp. WMMB6]|uniref:Crp/Fnr family transcriptional regulator n=1 Tax=Halioxenophilus sp. WMMB6 TaxID=3073815 RepID=UPI00295F55E2|nr:helix-turn-helix domain-containing protein [Halioxenophilus sp. WMMB6]
MIQLARTAPPNFFQNDYPLFRDLSEAELPLLADQAKLKVLDKQQYLCMQHSPSDRVFNIASGSAVVERISNDGRRQILAFVFPGDFVGLSNSDRFEYGIKCLTGTTAYEFKRQNLFDLSEKLPTLKANIKNIRALVLSLTFDQVYLLGQKKAHERVCFLLLHLLQRLPGATQMHLELPMTRADIADYLGLTVETVSRSMSKLKKEGLITLPTPNAVRIVDLEAVQELADIH